MTQRWIRYGLLAIALMALMAILITAGLRWDLTKSEWAAWVQAVGTIVAIGGAVWLTQRQIDAQAKMVLDAENRARKRANDALLAVVDATAKQFLNLELEMDDDDDFGTYIMTSYGGFNRSMHHSCCLRSI